MALADYYQRSAVAIAQVLSGFDEDAIRKRLEGCVLEVVVPMEAQSSLEGRHVLDLTIRLAARLYPTILIEGSPRIRREMNSLALLINPAIETESPDRPTHSIVIGRGRRPASSVAFYLGSNNWVANVSRRNPQRVGPTRNPFGAGVAACLGMAGIFRQVFMDGAEPEPDIAFRALPTQLGGSTTLASRRQEAILVGAGAVGHGVVWALSRLNRPPKLTVVDPEDLDLGNLQRYAMAQRGDVGRSKVEIACRHLTDAVPYRGTWASFVAAQGSRHELVLAALDSANGRRAVQASLPEVVINGWTQPGDLGVATHTFDGAGACLNCLYLPEGQVKNDDALYAEALGIPEQLGLVRTLLYSGQAVPDPLLNLVADRLGVPHDVVQPFSGRSIRELYREGVCGGAVLPIGRSGSPRGDVHVPLAHQSALAGVLMAARMFATRSSRTTLITRLDVLRAVHPEYTTQAASKDPRGICICQDRDYVEAYRAKYRAVR